MPNGRPTDYEERYCEMLVEHMKEGYSFESFGAKIDSHRDTLYEWAKVHPKFSDAKKRGMEACQYRFEKIGNTAMLGQDITDPKTGKKVSFKNFNFPAWMFSMKARFGWRDRVSIEHEGNPDKPIEIKNRSDEEILNRITELGDKLKSIKSE